MPKKVKYRMRGGCVLCLMCVYQCPVGAISINENESVQIDPSKCLGCGRCADNCQTQALERYEAE